MNYLDEVFRAYDIRGKYPEQINEKFAERLGKAYGAMDFKDIIVGCDNRPGSEKLKRALVKGLNESGTDVTDIGIGPTDYIFYAPQVFDKELAINITASHLPSDKNGFKTAFKQGNSFLPEHWEKLKNKFMRQEFKKGNGQTVNKADEMKQAYKKRIKEIALKYSDDFKCKIIVDNVNGTSLTSEILTELGAEVIEINPDRNPEPNRNSLKELSEKIIEKKADLGIAHDIDADRVVVADSEGKILDPDAMSHILIDILVEKGDTAIGTIDVSHTLEKKVKSKGAKYIISRVGDSFIADLVHKHNSILGFEASYHYYTNQFIAYSSGALIGILFAGISKKLAEIEETVPEIQVSRRKVDVKNKFEKMNKISEKIKEKYEVITDIDGIKFKLDNGACLIRASNTEDIIRFTVETNDKRKSEKITDELIEELI